MAGADAALPPCQKASCILQLSVSAGGLSAGVTLRTGPATTATLKVYRGAELVGQGADPVLRTAHSMTTTASLTPDTAYTWGVRVTEVSGHPAQSTGSVSTLHRRVTVQFLTDSVFDDSDSAGDFETVVAVNNQRKFPPLMPETISSGETTQIATAMYDDDMSLTSSFPPLYGLPMDNGSDEFADWATATGTLDTAAATTGLVPFQISVNSYVGFIVKGYYAVDFVS